MLQFLWLCLYTCLHLWVQGSVGLAVEPTSAICPGSCIAQESSCNSTLDDTNCGVNAKCCLDNAEGVREVGFDFSTLPTKAAEWEDTDISAESAVEETDFQDFQTNHDDLDPENSFSATSAQSHFGVDFSTMAPPGSSHTFAPAVCPGACIPKTHVSLCQYIVPYDHLCSPDKSCCATKEMAMQMQQQYLEEQDTTQEFVPAENECPGKCVHVSLTTFCDEVLPQYSCPADSKCCNQLLSSDAEEPVIECTGECLPAQSTYFCVPPFELVSGTINCKGSTVCCMKPQEEELVLQNENDFLQGETEFSTTPDYTEEQQVVTEEPELASDEDGELYHVYGDGQLIPLDKITPEDSMSQSFVYYTDVETEMGRVSLYKDAMGNTYQVSIIQQPQSGFQPHIHTLQNQAELQDSGIPEMHTQNEAEFQEQIIQQMHVLQNQASFQESGFQQMHPFQNEAEFHDSGLQPQMHKQQSEAEYQEQIFQQMHALQNQGDFQEPNFQQMHPFQNQAQFDDPTFKESFANLAQTERPLEQESTKPTISMPDDSDDMEENMKDVVLPEDGEPLPDTEPDVPPAERSMIRPTCPGSCISTFLRFTCKRSFEVYDGFSCPGRSVCCAKLEDIERHELYLKSLSPYFRAAQAVSQQHANCGIRGQDSEITTEKWCWQVAIINEQNQYTCGGVIIDNSWVLTAAHCVTGAVRQEHSLYVRAGVTDLTSAADNAVGQTRRAISVVVHYNHNSMSLDNDIALLKLQTPFELTRNVCVVCLPTSGDLPENPKCTVTGYGFASKGGTMTLKMHEAEAPLVDDMECIANVTDALASVFILPASSFCAGGQGDRESCQGDAGGPMVCENKDVYQLTGLVSWSLGCGREDVPSIYVKVPSFMGWINQIISASTFLKALS